MARNKKAFIAISKQAQRAEVIVARRFRPALVDNVKTIAKAIKDGVAPMTAVSDLTDVKRLNQLKTDFGIRYAVDGWNMSGHLIGKADYALYECKANLDISTTFSGADELVANHLAPNIESYIATTSALETKTTAKRYQKILRQGLIGWKDPKTGEIRALTPYELAKYFEIEGIAQTDHRARLMARTLTNWTYNEGATKQYENAGITYGEWLSTIDDLTGEWDAELNGTIVKLGGNFVESGDKFTSASGHVMEAGLDVPHPPLHPNCRCTIIPVIEY